MGHRWIGRYSQWLPFCSLPGSPITVRDSATTHSFLGPSSYLGIGIEITLPVARSVIQRVSPAGSTPVGVLSPSLSTVTLALSPLMVMAEILPLPFSATMSLPLAARMPSG